MKTLNNVLTLEKSLFLKFLLVGAVLIVLASTTSCSNGPGNPNPSDSPVTGDGTPVPPPPPGGTTPPPSGGDTPPPAGQTSYYSGYFYKASYYSGYESFVYVNGQSYYIGVQTASSVSHILNSLPTGWYTISFQGTLGQETGHSPQYYSYYPVAHIAQTY